MTATLEDRETTTNYMVSQGGGWDDELDQPAETQDGSESRVVKTKADWSRLTRRTAAKHGIRYAEDG